MKIIEIIKAIFKPEKKDIDVKQRIVLAELEAENQY